MEGWVRMMMWKEAVLLSVWSTEETTTALSLSRRLPARASNVGPLERHDRCNTEYSVQVVHIMIT